MLGSDAPLSDETDVVFNRPPFFGIADWVQRTCARSIIVSAMLLRHSGEGVAVSLRRPAAYSERHDGARARVWTVLRHSSPKTGKAGAGTFVDSESGMIIRS
jgi:hypothetical protein